MKNPLNTSIAIARRRPTFATSLRVFLAVITLVAFSEFAAAGRDPEAAGLGADLDVETDLELANSDAAIEAAAQAKRWAQEEKARAAKEEALSKKEADRAKKTEADAKAQMAKWHAEEKTHRTVRVAAEARTAKARTKLQAIQTELQAKEIEYNAIKDAADRAVAERNEVEQAIVKEQDRLHRLQEDMKAQKQRQAEAAEATKAARVKLDRVHASVVATAKRSEGWVLVRRPCSLKKEASEWAADTANIAAGEKLYGKLAGDNWLQVRSAKGSGFLAKSCLKN